MIHIILDSNVYSKTNNFSTPNFKALRRLLKENQAKLYVPHVVKREVETQQRNEAENSLAKVAQGIKELNKAGVSPQEQEFFKALNNDIQNKKSATLDHAESRLKEWMKEVSAEELPITLDQTNSAIDAYFTKGAPFKSLKAREDIPDAFIFQSIISKQVDLKTTLYVVVNDKGLKAALEKSNDLKVLNDLYQLINLEELQYELKDLDLADNFPKLIGAIKEIESQSQEISAILSKDLGELLVGEDIQSKESYIDPFEYNGATVIGYDEPGDSKLNFKKASYYGNGQIGIPFTCPIIVTAVYYIDKHEYWSLKEDNYHGLPSVTDHNDYYYEAEEEFTLEVEGIITVDIEVDQLDFENLTESIEITDKDLEVISTHILEIA